MNNAEAFKRGLANRDNELMVFDWNKAASLIKEKQSGEATAGLRGDWEWTGGSIYENGKPMSSEDTYVYLASTWAVPELMIDGEVYDCYLMQSQTPKWDAGTYWPQSALDILDEGTAKT